VTDVVAQLQQLQELVARATEPTTIEGVARVLVDEGVSVLGAVIGGFWVIVGDALELVHHAGQQPADRFARLPLTSDAPLVACVRQREPIWIESGDDYRRRFPASAARIDANAAYVCLPLVVGDHAIGGAVFAFSGDRVFAQPERVALAMIARQCAHAVERIELVKAERIARERAELLARRMSALQEIAARLAAARGLDEIARVLIDEGITAIGASSAALWKLENREAVLVAQLGSSRSVIEAVERISIDEPGALATALRTRAAQYLESREAAAARQPIVEARWSAIEAAAFVPLVAGGRVLGALGLAFAEPRPFEPSEREMLELFAGHAAQAIARARDDAAQRVLAEASSDLASSLDATAVLERVGRLTVETFADWCFVDLVQPDGSLRRVLVSHADPGAAELAARMRAFGSPASTAVASVVESQRPLLIEQIGDGHYDRLMQDAARSDAARALGACSLLCVPMSVGGRAIGALTWMTRARSLDARDEQFAGQVARAVAASLENARLYEAQLAAARRVGKLYELVVALSSARTPEDVASATARLATDAVGAYSSMIWMRCPDGTLRAMGSSAPPDWTAEWTVLPAEGSLPAHRVLATGKPIFVETAADYERMASTAFARAIEVGRLNAFAALPITVGGATAGVIALAFKGEHHFDVDECTFLAAIARSCEQALERSQSYANEAAARAEAESASRAKDEFLAMLGHELRNPLAPIVTALDLMRLRGIADGLRERAIIERQVQHLTRLVDDLLDISRITRGKIELRRTTEELIAAVEPAIDAIGPLVVQHRHQLAVDIPSTGLLVDGDPARLSQIVRNLLTNAVKFTPAGGQIAISARTAGDHVELEVRDNGRGIPDPLLPHVFEPFVQGAQGAERSGGGLGLGLAIVKSLVELHGGTVAMTSGARGTRVTVRLPLAHEAAPATPSGRTVAVPKRSLRVLVVDDNLDAAALIGELLRILGHEPVIAHDGPGALAVADRDQPELAILDIGLPGMDGYELARRLRERPGLAGVPVVALTGYGQASDRDRTKAAGFVEHLVKPIDLQRLHELVGRFV
jgi:signal transduction histidine kinase